MLLNVHVEDENYKNVFVIKLVLVLTIAMYGVSRCFMNVFPAVCDCKCVRVWYVLCSG